MSVIKDIKQIHTLVSLQSSIDEPIEYKGLTIYPVRVKDYYKFGEFYDFLTFDKNTIHSDNIIEIIEMSNLKFYATVLLQDESLINNIPAKFIWGYKFSAMLEICLHERIENVEFTEEDGEVFIHINNVKLDTDEFDFIKRVILCQTIVDYDDTYVDPEVQKAKEDYFNYMNKDSRNLTIEDKKAIITSVCGLSYTEQLSLTYRDFCVLFEACRKQIDYIALVGKTEKPLPHWIYGKETDSGAFTQGGALGNIIENSELIQKE